MDTKNAGKSKIKWVDDILKTAGDIWEDIAKDWNKMEET